MTLLTEGYSLFHLYLCSRFLLAMFLFQILDHESIFQLWSWFHQIPSLGWHHQTSALAGSAVDRLNNVDELLERPEVGWSSGRPKFDGRNGRKKPVGVEVVIETNPLFPPKRHLLVIHGPVHLVVVSWAQKQENWKTSDKGLEEWQGTILCIGNKVVCENPSNTRHQWGEANIGQPTTSHGKFMTMGFHGTCAQVDHHVLVAEEEHHCHRIVEP